MSYGNGVVTSLRARRALAKRLGWDEDDITVIDSPYLSGVRQGLVDAVTELSHVVFVDVCKQGQHPFAGFISDLQSKYKVYRFGTGGMCLLVRSVFDTLLTTHLCLLRLLRSWGASKALAVCYRPAHVQSSRELSYVCQ